MSPHQLSVSNRASGGFMRRSALLVLLLSFLAVSTSYACTDNLAGECTNRGSCVASVCACITGFVGADCQDTVDDAAHAVVVGSTGISESFTFTVTVNAVTSYTIEAPTLSSDAGTVACSGYTVAVQPGGLQWIVTSTLATFVCGPGLVHTTADPSVYTGATLSQNIVRGTDPLAIVVTTNWPITISKDGATQATSAATMAPVVIDGPGSTAHESCTTTLALYAATDVAFATPLGPNPAFEYNAMFGVCISQAGGSYVAITDSTFSIAGGALSGDVYTKFDLSHLVYAAGKTCYQVAMPGNPAITTVVVDGICQVAVPSALPFTVESLRAAAAIKATKLKAKAQSGRFSVRVLDAASTNIGATKTTASIQSYSANGGMALSGPMIAVVALACALGVAIITFAIVVYRRAPEAKSPASPASTAVAAVALSSVVVAPVAVAAAAPVSSGSVTVHL